MKVLVSETNLNEVLEYIYFSFEQEAKEKGIKLLREHGLPLKEAIVYADQNKVNAILINLLKNAIKFTDHGAIKFGYVREGASLLFFVKDTGIGIDSTQKNIIFERFERIGTKLMIDNTGSGFGLSVSKAYVELCGGKIWVESEFGHGSSFYFTIPYDSVKKERKNLLQKPVVSNGYLKILIAEDDEVSEKLIRKLLGNFAWEMISVKSGIEAVNSCRNNPDIDLIIMDIYMPEMNGYEATKQIRLFNIEVIIVAQTAMAFDVEREKAIDAGCDDFITKPFPANVFERLLKKHFELT